MAPAPVLRAAHVRRPPADAFRLFTEHIGAWWPLPSHGLFGDRAGTLSFRDGRLVEQAVTGEETVWGEVLVWEPPHRLAITWHPGRTDGPASTVEVRFTGDADGTRVELTHHGWEAFGERAGAARQGYVGPSAWGHVLDHYADVADRDDERAPVDALRRAYAAFFAEAEAGGFAPPTDGGWNAEQVVGHLLVNDASAAAVCRAIVHGRSVTFDNAVANDRARLDAVVNAHGDLAALVAAGRRDAETLCLLLARLDDEQLATAVPCHLVDGGEVMVDQPLPWGRLMLGVQVEHHLPAHTEQLAALRPAPATAG